MGINFRHGVESFWKFRFMAVLLAVPHRSLSSGHKLSFLFFDDVCFASWQTTSLVHAHTRAHNTNHTHTHTHMTRRHDRTYTHTHRRTVPHAKGVGPTFRADTESFWKFRFMTVLLAVPHHDSQARPNIRTHAQANGATRKRRGPNIPR